MDQDPDVALRIIAMVTALQSGDPALALRLAREEVERDPAVALASAAALLSMFRG